MSSDNSSNTLTPNSFTQGSLGSIFARTALPVIFVMSMNGLLSVVDAIFLGIYVGPKALGAVTLMFPVYMLVVALSTLVANGMSSELARFLGAKKFTQAQALFAGAHGLALTISALFIAAFLLVGKEITLLTAGGIQDMADMGHAYLGITILSTPLIFVLSIHSDALRNEGHAGMMAAMSLLVSLANILFNYILIVIFEMGVEGSAYGTVLAQMLAFVIIIAFRMLGKTYLKPDAAWHHSPTTGWKNIVALGAPQSLNFLGVALISIAIISTLQMIEIPHYANTITAYGINTRIMTFTFLPLLGLSYAMQSITGNNYGAKLWQRSDSSLRIGIMISLVYCVVAEIILMGYAAQIGRLFVDDETVVAELARIIPLTIPMLFSVGPMLILATYFQAIGDASRAAILSLTKTYFFALPLVFILPWSIGEIGVWLAGPFADVLLIATAIFVLLAAARKNNRKWGLFAATNEVKS